jgi:hypothetical protein
MLLFGIVLSLTPYRSLADLYLAPAILSFLGFCMIGIVNSFSAVGHFGIVIVMPLAFGLAMWAFLKLPVGPFDIGLILPSAEVTRFVAGTVGVFFGSMHISTVLTFVIASASLKDVKRNWARGEINRKFALRTRQWTCTLVQGIHDFFPTNVFMFVVLRFYFTKLPDTVMDLLYVGTDVMMAIFRFWVAGDCVQVLLLATSMEGFVNFDTKRTQTAAREASDMNDRSYSLICRNMLATIMPACVQIVMSLAYAWSWVASGDVQLHLRLWSMFLLGVNDMVLMGQQIMPQFVTGTYQ